MQKAHAKTTEELTHEISELRQENREIKLML